MKTRYISQTEYKYLSTLTKGNQLEQLKLLADDLNNTLQRFPESSGLRVGFYESSDRHPDNPLFTFQVTRFSEAADSDEGMKVILLLPGETAPDAA